MLELPDTAGLICGFHLFPESPAQPLVWNGSETEQNIAGPAWLHFQLSDVRAQSWLSACDRIPPAWRDLVLGTDRHIRIETSVTGFAGVLGDLRFEAGADPDHLDVLCFYVDERFIFTARLHALKSVDELRQEIRNGLPLATPMDVLLRFLENATDTFAQFAKQQGELVDDIEDLALKDRFLEESDELGAVRRFLTRLRRHVDAQRRALEQLAHRPPRWFTENDRSELRRSVERLNAVYLDLEAIQERARLLKDEIAGRLASATNRNLYVVSLFTAVFLPITLISGIFGMNVGGLPWLNQQTGFGWVIALMIFTITGSLALLHWRRFF